MVTSGIHQNTRLSMSIFISEFVRTQLCLRKLSFFHCYSVFGKYCSHTTLTGIRFMKKCITSSRNANTRALIYRCCKSLKAVAYITKLAWYWVIMEPSFCHMRYSMSSVKPSRYRNHCDSTLCTHRRLWNSMMILCNGTRLADIFSIAFLVVPFSWNTTLAPTAVTLCSTVLYYHRSSPLPFHIFVFAIFRL